MGKSGGEWREQVWGDGEAFRPEEVVTQDGIWTKDYRKFTLKWFIWGQRARNTIGWDYHYHYQQKVNQKEIIRLISF